MATRIRKTRAILQEENEALRAKYTRSLDERKKLEEQLHESDHLCTWLGNQNDAFHEWLSSQYRLIVEYDVTSERDLWIFRDFDTKQELVRHHDVVEGYKAAIAIRRRQWQK